MFPLSGLLGLGSSLFDFFGQNDDAEDLAQANFNWTLDEFKDLMEMLQAPVRDAYGNTTMYRPNGIGWYTKTTPGTKSILASEQQEQIKSLTEDADRNREFRKRMDQQGRDAEQEYGQVMADYHYGEKPNEQGIIDDLTRLMTINRTKGLEQGGEVLAKQALRQESNPSIMRDLSRNLDETWGKSLEESIIQGRQVGQKEFQDRTAFRDRDLQSWLNNFMNVAKSVPQAQIINPDIADTLMNSRNQAQSALTSGQISGMGLVGNAAKANIAAQQKTPSTSGIASSIGKLFGGGSGGAGGLLGSAGSDSLSSAGADAFAPELARQAPIGSGGVTSPSNVTSGDVFDPNVWADYGDPLWADPNNPQYQGGEYLPTWSWNRSLFSNPTMY